MKRSPLQRTAKARTRPRDTGPSAATRDLIVRRCRYTCERCGCGAEGGLQIHHRKPRRMGGTADPAVNAVSNLVMLCDGCHLRGVEVNRLQAYRDGYLVYAMHDPAKVAVKIYARGYVLLADDGTYAGETHS